MERNEIEKEAYPFGKDYPPQKADPQDIPEPTIWPIGLAFGVLFIFWGFIASAGLTITGVVITGVSLAGWIADLKP
ncbi:MAG: hypothetical protein KDC05_15120 [Bacteroidales bacterium]|nr:hypothetical protein [Bacteroidales bacterium]